MTPEEFAEKMAAIIDNHGDLEGRHYAADELIIGLLRELGYGKGADLFDETEKWYA